MRDLARELVPGAELERVVQRADDRRQDAAAQEGDELGRADRRRAAGSWTRSPR